MNTLQALLCLPSHVFGLLTTALSISGDSTRLDQRTGKTAAQEACTSRFLMLPKSCSDASAFL